MDTKAVATIARMAERGTLEVEHLLRLARHPSPALADALDDLATSKSWQSHPCFPEVPLGTWARVVSGYCREGYSGLIDQAREPDMLAYVLGLLEELKTEEALSAVVSIAEIYHRSSPLIPDRANEISSALNLAAMSSLGFAPTEAQRIVGRNFLHGALAQAFADNQRGTILCSLRYFGDDTSLGLISACPPLRSEWEPTRGAAIRAIKKSVKHRAAVSHLT